MGNIKGNTAVETELPSIKHSLDSWRAVNKSYLSLDESRSPSTSTAIPNNNLSSLFNHTTLRGEVIAFHAPTFSKDEIMLNLSKSVDGCREKVEETNDDMEENEENKDGGDLRDTTNLKKKNTPKLKFGIDSILDKTTDTEKSPRNSLTDEDLPKLYARDETENSTREALSRSSEGSLGESSCDNSSSEDNTRKLDHIRAKYLSEFFASKRQQQLQTYTQKMQRENIRRLSHSFHHHPYLTKEKCNSSRNLSDPTPSFPYSAERLRRKSESPKRRMFFETTSRVSNSPDNSVMNNTSGENPKCLPNCTGLKAEKFRCLPSMTNTSQLTESESRSKSLNSSPFELMPSLSKPTNSEKDRSPKAEHARFFESFRASINEHIGIGIRKRLCSESDEVFNDEAIRKTPPFTHFKPALWNQRQTPTEENHVNKSPTEFIPISQNHRQGENSFFPTVGNSQNTPPFPATLPPQFNLQSWQQALASSCHPSYRHLVFPYAYGHNAAVAMATAMRQSLRNFASSNMMLSENMQPHKFADKNNFRLQDSRNVQQPFTDKGNGPRKRRKWSRAVFSLMQRRGLEKSFQMQKYVAKPERRGLADALGLTDAQVKIWFQNRRMKWRQEQKSGNKLVVGDDDLSPNSAEDTFSQVCSQ